MALQKSDRGDAVIRLQQDLQDAGFNPGPADGIFGGGTEGAVLAFQRSEDLTPTGLADDETLERLNRINAQAATAAGELGKLTISRVAAMFPGAQLESIRRHLPVVIRALVDANLIEPRVAVMALATIRAETAGFVPINEFVSEFNTSPGGRPFDRYDDRADLGNHGAPDGERFKGRGFIQLTGRHNYARIGEKIGLGNQLIDNPDLANEPEVAAKILACFIQDKLPAISAALEASDLAQARRLVNGGRHGLDRFAEAYEKGMTLFA